MQIGKTKQHGLSYKTALKASAAAAVLMAFATPSAFAQTTIEITDDTIVFDPGTGNTVNVAAGVTQTVANTPGDDDPDNGNIVLDSSSNDQVTIINAGTLINLDEQDENVVIFVDNGEDQVNITNAATGLIQGFNGAIFFEGDEATLTNNGTIEGTGNATEGVIYFDRDADSNLNTIINTGTISSVGGATIGIDSLLGTAPSSGDTAAATAAAPNVFTGTTNFTLNNSGTISNSDTADDGDSDAINFNGDNGSTSEGSTGSSQRGCLETSAGATLVQCQFNVDITNSGVISTARDAGSNAAIFAEDDAVINGTITNVAGGSITGAGNGIVISGAQAEHDLTISNAGTIAGTSTAGLTITGDGVTLNNQAGGVINGGTTGLLVAGSTATFGSAARNDANTETLSNETTELAVAAINNTFVNAGTISGATSSVDLSGAGEAVTFEQQGGGALLGDFLGTTGFTDTLNFTNGATTLTNDVLQDVNVNVASGATLDVDGARTIDGNLVSDGALDFVLGTDSLTVTGDTILNAGSFVNVADTNGAVTAPGQSFTLINSAGTLTSAATLATTAVDDSFLLDFVTAETANGDFVLTSVAAAAEGPTPEEIAQAEAEAAAAAEAAAQAQAEADAAAAAQAEADAAAAAEAEAAAAAAAAEAEAAAAAAAEAAAAAAALAALAETRATFTSLNGNVQTFGNTLISAFNAAALDAPFATELAEFSTNQQIESFAASLIPEVNNAVAREAFEVSSTINSFIDRRFTQQCRDETEEVSENDYAPCEQGFWAQAGYQFGNQTDQDNISITGYEVDIANFAVGYDYALNNDTIIGISGGYSSIDIDNDRANANEDDVDLLNVTLYASRDYGPWFANGQAGYSFGDVDSVRVGINNDLITSSSDVTGFNVQGIVGYDFDLRGAGYFTPVAGIHFGNFSQDGFTEEGGLNLTVGDLDTTYVEGKAGVRTGNLYDFGDSQFNVDIRALYVYDFAGNVDDLDVTLAGGQTASLETLQGSTGRAEIGAGFSWRNASGLTVGFDVDGEAGSNYTSIGGAFRLKYKL